jgi:hypothetical protein
LYNSTIPGLTVVPYIQFTTNYPTPPLQYNCQGCHSDAQPPIVERECLVCHGEYSNGDPALSPHHGTAQANAGDCKFCHGSLVDNSGDGHYIPTYDPSLVTPTPSQGDADQENAYFNGAGACNYCHDSDTPPGGMGTGNIILSNRDTHHGINLINFGDRCEWCHYLGNTPPSPIPADWYENNQPDAIRGCEECHGPDSLHNIQTDSDGNGIVIGGELQGYGHVGRDQGPDDSDCWGCHGFAGISGAAPYSGPIVPSVNGADVSTMNAGTATTVTLTGAAFTNIDGEVEYVSVVALTAADGSSVTLTPDSISEGTLTVTIPGDTAAGNISLQAVKDDKSSNPSVISIIPAAVVTNTTCADGTATITGSGFSGYQEGSGTEVTGTIRSGKGKNKTTTTETGAVSSWSDTQIVADFSACPQSVDVTTVFASDGGGDPPAGTCSDNTTAETCPAPDCEWSENKKGRGSCRDAGSNGGGGGKPPKNK